MQQRQPASEQVVANARRLIAEVDRALQAGRQLFAAHGIDHRRMANQLKRSHGAAGSERFRAECDRVVALIDGGSSQLKAHARFAVQPTPHGGSRRPRSLV